MYAADHLAAVLMFQVPRRNAAAVPACAFIPCQEVIHSPCPCRACLTSSASGWSSTLLMEMPLSWFCTSALVEGQTCRHDHISGDRRHTSAVMGGQRGHAECCLCALTDLVPLPTLATTAQWCKSLVPSTRCMQRLKTTSTHTLNSFVKPCFLTLGLLAPQLAHLVFGTRAKNS